MHFKFKIAAEAIKKSDAILVTAGAGIGVDSGLPDFRGNEGFWRTYPPIAKLGISFYEMANPDWFQNDPHLAWAFYGHRLNLYRSTMPHAGFFTVLEEVQRKENGYFVFTSNVDGQFQKAGYSDNQITECHGSIHYLQCSRVCTNNIWSADSLAIAINREKFRACDPLPLCPNCGSIVRPNILMFGDWGWISHRSSKQETRLGHWLENLHVKQSKLVILEIGAGTAVPTVRHLSEKIARNFSALLIRINPRDYHVPQGHISIPENAAKGIQHIFEFL